MNVLLYIIVITISFSIYIECSVTGILFRPDGLGKSSFNFYSLFSYLIDPLHKSFLWNIQLLDVNYIFVLGISLFLYYMFNTI